MLNSFISYDTAIAAELFAAAWCNLDCTYCYIPKHNQMITDKHKEIIREVQQVTPIIERLKKLYGDKLEITSHWGTEPSLTLHYFKDFYKEVIKVFPKFRKIALPSNFLQNTDKVIDFIKSFPTDRKITFDVQMSLDGHPWITDSNRRGGTTNIITKNIVKFVNGLNEEPNLYHIVKVHFKPTMSRHQYKTMLKDDNVYQYYKFFDDVCDKMEKVNKYKNVFIAYDCDPTAVCPDDYTKEDGINFNTMYEETIKVRQKNLFKRVRPDSNYYFNIIRITLLAKEFFTKHKMFTCSAGDSQFGVSEYLHPCHDTFYHPYDALKEAYYKDTDRLQSNQDIQNVQSGRIDLGKKVFCKKIDNLEKKELWKYIYNMRSFHDFAKFRISFGVGVIKEMSHCGQISRCYKNDEMAELLSIFTTTRHSCPTRHVQHIGSKHLVDMSYFKLFGNGLVENFLKRIIKEERIF